MDFTREPIIETIITPRDGCKLVVRSSKSAGQEEYFVDAVEVVSFGQALFFRSLERPKAFLVPVNDYEVLEVREARMVLKNIGPDRSIKIGGGREAAIRATREEKPEAALVQPIEEVIPAPVESEIQPVETTADGKTETRLDKKRDRRRHYRKRRGREETTKEEGTPETAIPSLEEEKVHIQPPETIEPAMPLTTPLSSSLLSSLLQPPPTLISETINRYRENALFKNAFFLSEEEQYKPHDKAHELLNEDDEELAPPLQEPTYEPFEESVQAEAVTEEVPEEGDFFEESLQEQEEQEQELFEGSNLPVSDEESNKESPEGNEATEAELAEDKEQEQEASLPLYAEEEKTVAQNGSLEEQEKILPHEHESHQTKKNTYHHQEDLPF